MQQHHSGCLVCGAPLVYSGRPGQLSCEICGETFAADASCAEGHYVCDGCHAQTGYLAITRRAKTAVSKNAVAIATQMMADGSVHMHGPEHHYLVVAALLAAYQNAGGHINLARALQTASLRARAVPGGVCGQWGSCGAAIGSGIFISLIGGATPLSVEPWQLANRMTAESLLAISQNGGPRCCKRDTYLAIAQATEFVQRHFGVDMETAPGIRCAFSARNPTCKRETCLYYPAH